MYVVTGGAGFIGSSFIWYLNQQGIEDVLVVDRFSLHPEKWKNLRGLRFRDVLTPEQLIELVEKSQLIADYVINLGACTDTTQRDFGILLEQNYRFAQRLCRYCLEKKIRFVHASSAATYGLGEKGFSDSLSLLPYLRPLNPYGYSKHLFDLWALKEGIIEDIVVLKYFNVFGPNEYHKGNMRSMVLKAYEQVLETRKVKLFRSTHPDFKDGQQKRDFIYVKDVVKITYELATSLHARGVYNVGTGQARTWIDLVSAVFSVLNLPINIEFVDMPEYLRPQYQNFTEAETGRLKCVLPGLKVTGLEDGVKDYIQNYLSPNRWLGDDLIDSPKGYVLC